MDNYETEEQQVEAIKKWLHENYIMLILVSFVGIASIVGVQQWKQNKLINAQVASLEYDQILQSPKLSDKDEESDKKKIETITKGVEILQSEYSDYPYAALASLLEAKKMLESGNLSEAEKNYNWVINNTNSQTLEHMARINLATILSSQGKNEEALKIIGTEHGSFKASYMETQGDIFVLLERTNEAKSAYDQALQAYAAIGANAQILEVKRNDLGNL